MLVYQKKKFHKSQLLKKLYPVILNILDKAQEEKPDTVTFLNLFNSGIIIDSERVKRLVIKFLRDNLR